MSRDDAYFNRIGICCLVGASRFPEIGTTPLNGMGKDGFSKQNPYLDSKVHPALLDD
jgi:hypothetical protein